jgi:hypothetical protein
LKGGGYYYLGCHKVVAGGGLGMIGMILEHSRKTCKINRWRSTGVVRYVAAH